MLLLLRRRSSRAVACESISQKCRKQILGKEKPKPPCSFHCSAFSWTRRVFEVDESVSAPRKYLPHSHETAPRRQAARPDGGRLFSQQRLGVFLANQWICRETSCQFLDPNPSIPHAAGPYLMFDLLLFVLFTEPPGPGRSLHPVLAGRRCRCFTSDVGSAGRHCSA